MMSLVRHSLTRLCFQLLADVQQLVVEVRDGGGIVGGVILGDVQCTVKQCNAQRARILGLLVILTGWWLHYKRRIAKFLPPITRLTFASI